MTLIRWEANQVRPREGTALAWLAVLDQLRAELEQDGGGGSPVSRLVR